MPINEWGELDKIMNSATYSYGKKDMVKKPLPPESPRERLAELRKTREQIPQMKEMEETLRKLQLEVNTLTSNKVISDTKILELTKSNIELKVRLSKAEVGTFSAEDLAVAFNRFIKVNGLKCGTLSPHKELLTQFLNIIYMTMKDTSEDTVPA